MLGRDGQGAMRARSCYLTQMLGGLALLLVNACSLSVIDDLENARGNDPADAGDGMPERDAGDGDAAVQSPLCSDLEQNGGETAVDCGGNNDCDRCDPGKACVEHTDCTSAHCLNRVCQPPTCDDKIKNQDELAVDCGGPNCDECDPCENERKDEGEADVDCGGTCATQPCATNGSCTKSADCATGSCVQQECRPGRRGAYWPVSEWIGATQIPAEVSWTAVSHVFVAYVGITPELECAFWTDENGSDMADASARSAVADLIAYRNAEAPNVKVLLSIGGPLLSYRMSAAARSSATRTKFAASCVTLMRELGADGLDVDWRFPTAFAGPASGAGSCRAGDGCESSSDAQNLTALLMELRSQYTAQELKGKLLSAVLRANAGGAMGNVPYDYGSLFGGNVRLLDWASVAAYDIHGAGDTKVDFGAPFAETIEAMDFAKERAGTEFGRDLFLGVSFAGPFWSGVSAPGPTGIGNSGTPGGTLSYRTVSNYLESSPSCAVNTPSSGDVRNRYVYCSGTVAGLTNPWISFDDTTVLGNKAKFAATRHFAGVNWWLEGQDTENKQLVQAIVQGMDGQNPFFDAPLTMPGMVQAEEYDTGGEQLAYHDTTLGNSYGVYRSDDVEVQACADPLGGSYNVEMVADEWIEHTITPTVGGQYTVEIRFASESGNGQVHLEEKGTRITPTANLPSTGGKQKWTTVELLSSALDTQTKQLRLRSTGGTFGVNWIRYSRGQNPYLGAAAPVPGTVQAEYFDIGGQNVAYFDKSTSTHAVERLGPVLIEPNPETLNGLTVRDIQPGEWLEYTVDVAQAGKHNLEVRMAASAAHSFHLESVNSSGVGTLLGEAINTPVIGEFDEYLTVEGRVAFNLAAGQQVLRLAFDTVGSGHFNLNWLKFTRGQVPYSGTAIPIPGTIQTEAFDLGGSGEAYLDATPGNAFVKYRYTDVDIETCTDMGGGFDVTSVNAGDWTEYTVDVDEAGTYDIQVRAASFQGSNGLHFEIDGANIGGIAIPDNDGVWSTYTIEDVALSAGPQVIRAAFDDSKASYNYFRVVRSN